MSINHYRHAVAFVLFIGLVPKVGQIPGFQNFSSATYV